MQGALCSAVPDASGSVRCYVSMCNWSHKPGHPSHAIHTCQIGNLRLVFDAQFEPGMAVFACLQTCLLVKRRAAGGRLQGCSPATRHRPVKNQAIFRRLAMEDVFLGRVSSSTPFSYVALDLDWSTGLSSQRLRLA